MTLATFVALAVAGSARGADEPSPGDDTQPAPASAARWNDTGRLYLQLATGFVFLVDDGYAGATHFESHEFPKTNHVNIPISVAVGYNLTEHFGFEVQGVGTEPDVTSDFAGKLAEYSNITVFGSLRYRHPIGDGRLVPWVLGGIGWSINDLNDTTNTRIKLTGDGSTIAGTVATGVDYFLADDISVGAALQGFIYPGTNTEVANKDTGKIVRGNTNLSSIAVLLHLNMYFGQQASPDGSSPQTLLLADHGTYDSDERRYYLVAMAGDQIYFDDGFNGVVKAKSPGSANWQLGGAVGMNFDEHWGAELQLVNTDVNINNGAQGKIGEMSAFTILPTARFRWQFLDGRLVPFATAGLGVNLNRPNDPRNSVDVFEGGTQRTPRYELTTASVAASVGVGLEYFLNRHISVALAVPLMIYPDWDTTLQQRNAAGNVGKPVHGSWNYTGIAPTLRITAYVP
ncbi:MAG TPA: outer membrane beta-barrel protein [Candidatus Binatia bacterium]|nr:outer membrane beta-barrel protein [Candidatus Binatia bacterium]